VQSVVGRVLSIFWIPATTFAMRFIMRYRIPNALNLRKRFRKMVKESDGPILICANHLTMVDSAVMAWALGGSWWYLFNYRRVPWNLPEHSNYGFKWYNRVGVWILKCIPVRRGGRREDIAGVLKRDAVAPVGCSSIRSRTAWAESSIRFGSAGRWSCTCGATVS
jgi:1-acyl-sn-glycerol-3-phosphate acyltransferase